MLFNVDDITGDGFQIKTRKQSEWVTNIPELVDDLSGIGLTKDIDVDFDRNKNNKRSKRKRTN